MFKNLIMLGAGWFIYTKPGRKVAKNVALNLIPYIEKEYGIQIKKPLQELMKEVKL